MQNHCKTVPVIDVGALAAPDSTAYDQLCCDLGHAYSTMGFGYIQNHGISNELIAGMIEAATDFHALPMAEKMKIELNQNHRGYIPMYSAKDKPTMMKVQVLTGSLAASRASIINHPPFHLPPPRSLLYRDFIPFLKCNCI